VKDISLNALEFLKKELERIEKCDFNDVCLFYEDFSTLLRRVYELNYLVLPFFGPVTFFTYLRDGGMVQLVKCLDSLIYDKKRNLDMITDVKISKNDYSCDDKVKCSEKLAMDILRVENEVLYMLKKLKGYEKLLRMDNVESEYKNYCIFKNRTGYSCQMSKIVRIKERLQFLCSQIETEKFKDFINKMKKVKDNILTYDFSFYNSKTLSENKKIKLWSSVKNLFSFDNSTYFFSKLESYFNFFGVNVTTHFSSDEFKIKMDLVDTDKIIACKKEYFEKWLEERSDVLLENCARVKSSDEVNEKELKDLIINNKIPIVLNSNINNLVDNLIFLMSNDGIKIDDLIDLDKSGEFGLLCEIKDILVQQGFSLSNESIFDDVLDEYKNVGLDREFALQVVGKLLQKKFSDNYPCSFSIQKVYNCIDRNLISLMHEELNNNCCGKNLKKVIKLIKKYSRNKDGECFSNNEILSFLREKNEIVNTFYSINGYDIEEFGNKLFDIFNKSTKKRFKM